MQLREHELVDQKFDGLTLTGSKFDGARMSKTSFRGATMVLCSLRDLRKGPALQNAVDADFTGATLSLSSFSFLASYVGIFFNAVFNGARLDETVWESVGTDQNLCKGPLCSVLNPDFRNANLRGARFPAMRFHNLGFGTHRCTFQGADLSGTNFRPAFPRTATDLSMCRFDREPESGRITSFRNAHLERVRASGADFSDADFTNAILANTPIRRRGPAMLQSHESPALVLHDLPPRILRDGSSMLSVAAPIGGPRELMGKAATAMLLAVGPDGEISVLGLAPTCDREVPMADYPHEGGIDPNAPVPG